MTKKRFQHAVLSCGFYFCVRCSNEGNENSWEWVCYKEKLLPGNELYLCRIIFFILDKDILNCQRLFSFYAKKRTWVYFVSYTHLPQVNLTWKKYGHWLHTLKLFTQNVFRFHTLHFYLKNKHDILILCSTFMPNILNLSNKLTWFFNVDVSKYSTWLDMSYTQLPQVNRTLSYKTWHTLWIHILHLHSWANLIFYIDFKKPSIQNTNRHISSHSSQNLYLL